jgi:hypothetical protein
VTFQGKDMRLFAVGRKHVKLKRVAAEGFEQQGCDGVVG